MAEVLVNATVIGGPDRYLEDRTDAASIVAGMIQVLVDLPAALATTTGDLEPGAIETVLKQHGRLLSFLRAQVLGPDDADELEPDDGRHKP